MAQNGELIIALSPNGVQYGAFPAGDFQGPPDFQLIEFTGANGDPAPFPLVELTGNFEIQGNRLAQLGPVLSGPPGTEGR